MALSCRHLPLEILVFPFEDDSKVIFAIHDGVPHFGREQEPRLGPRREPRIAVSAFNPANQRP
jgi:hypothetical protein